MKQIRERGDNGLFIMLVPKVFNNIFLFVGSTTLGTLVDFDLSVHLVKCSNVSTTNFYPQKG